MSEASTTVTATFDERESRHYETVIGIETHVELGTRTKMFCACATTFGAEPNTQVCPVCLGEPGSLPVVNGTAIEYAARIGLALNCRIAERSQFHRKNYFYPDMPKNYQISQYDEPLCVGGYLDVPVEGEVRRFGITRVHLEEDTGKSLHVGTTGRIHGADHSLVDYNRAGIPLVEIVSEPDMRSAEEARAYAEELRAVLLALGVSDVKLEEGSMRFDVNVSIRPLGHAQLGTKVELKNLNSLRSLYRAVGYESERQRRTLAEGGQLVQETRHWDESTGRTEPMRSKEYAMDYRYFPEPDLVPIEASPEWVDGLRAALPELPAERRARLAKATGLGPKEVGWHGVGDRGQGRAGRAVHHRGEPQDDRKAQGPCPDLGHRGARGGRGNGRRRQPGPGRQVPRRQVGRARRTRRPGDARDTRTRQPQGRQRAAGPRHQLLTAGTRQARIGPGR